MIKCINNVNGVCSIATYLAKRKVQAVVSESTCRACLQMEHPQSINKATCGLAVISLYRAGLFRIEAFNHLVKCGETLYGPTTEVKDRPGAALRNIINSIGVKEPASCYCEEYAAAMDSWGHSGCVERKQEIIDHLNGQTVSWLDMIKVAAAGYLTTRSLVDAALEASKP